MSRSRRRIKSLVVTSAEESHKVDFSVEDGYAVFNLFRWTQRTSPRTVCRPASSSDSVVPPSNSSISSATDSAGTKRPRLALGGGGGSRLFGLVNSTLKKAKVENEKNQKGEAAQQRADLEARLQKTTQKPSTAYSAVPSHILKNRTRLEDEVRRDTIALQTLVDRILTEESLHKSLKIQKRRLASFLVTKAPRNAGIRGRVIAPDVPGAIFPSSRPTTSSQARDRDPAYSAVRGSPTRTEARDGKGTDTNSREPDNAALYATATIPDPSTYALYFLPKKLTPSQEDLLDDQEDKCDAELDRMDSQVERKVNDMKNNLERMKFRVKGRRKELDEIKKTERAMKEKNRETRTEDETQKRKEMGEKRQAEDNDPERPIKDENMDTTEDAIEHVTDEENRNDERSRSRSLSKESKTEEPKDKNSDEEMKEE